MKRRGPVGTLAMRARAIPLCQWLVAAGCLVAGLALTIHALGALKQFLSSAGAGASPVETDSFVFALPFFGLVPLLGVAAIAIRLLAPADIAAWESRVFGALLIVAGAAIALSMLGTLLVNAWMGQHGYRSCSSFTGIRATFTIWVHTAVPAEPCPQHAD